MAIPSSINIPNLYVPSGLESALKAGIPAFQRTYQQGIQNKQAQQQQDLREQLANMHMQQMGQAQAMAPLKQQLMQAQIGQTEAKTAGMPMAGQQAMDYKQRTQDNKIIELVTNNPDLLNNPEIAKRFGIATQNVSQPLYAGAQQPQQPQQQLGAGQPGMQLPPQAPQMPGQQMGGPAQGTPDIGEQMMFRQEQKMIPAETKNMMMRSTSAKLMMDDVEQDINQLEPFFGKTNSLKGAVRAFAADKGLSDDKAGMIYNSLSKKIKALGGEVAAGMSKSRSEATIREWQHISNPITSGTVSFDQVKNNIDSLRDIHSLNHETLFSNYPISRKHDSNFYQSRSAKIKSKYGSPKQDVPRGTTSAQPQYSQSAIQAELKRRGLV